MKITIHPYKKIPRFSSRGTLSLIIFKSSTIEESRKPQTLVITLNVSVIFILSDQKDLLSILCLQYTYIQTEQLECNSCLKLLFCLNNKFFLTFEDCLMKVNMLSSVKCNARDTDLLFYFR